jgi:uncharacterized protein
MEPLIARVPLRVSPGSTRSVIVGRYGNAWKVRIAAPPQEGRANDALVDLLARSLGIARTSIRVVAGLSSRDKVVEVTGLTLADAERRLDSAGKETA